MEAKRAWPAVAVAGSFGAAFVVGAVARCCLTLGVSDDWAY